MRRLQLLLAVLLLWLPGFLGAEGFTGWQRTSTKHFVFVYEKRDRAVVAELRSFAEDVYAQVTRFFGSYPKRIWVVVDGRVDTANGYYTGVTSPSHLVLYVTSPSVPILGTKERQYLRLLLTHELTHYVHLDYDRGFFAALSDVLGPGMKPFGTIFMPDWMKEGIAVNNETMFTHGGRGRDPFFEMEYRALVLDNHFFSLKQAAYGSAFPPQDRVYVGGYLIVHYLLEHFGPDTFAEIQRRFAKFPLFGPWAAIKAVTGVSAETIYQRMLKELRRDYARYSTIPSGRLISPNRVGDYELPVVTKRGWYEYRSNLDSAPAVVRIDPQTRKEQLLVDTSLTDYTSLTADRSGDKIVYAAFDVTLGPAGTTATSDLFTLDPNSRRITRLTVGKHLWQPALSPDGDTLVAVQRQENYSRLVLVDQGTSTVRPLFYRRETNVYNPSFSPNGRLLTFALNDHGHQRIMVLDLHKALASPNGGGAVARTLPSSPDANAFFPRFSGNSHVVFVADLGSGLALYEAGLDGGALDRVADDPVGVSAGLILGNEVIYTSYSKYGTVVREKPVERVAVSEPAKGAGASVAPSPSGGGATVSLHGRRYVDWPRPLFWLPLPFYDYFPANAVSLPFGIGAAVYGSSLLGRNSFALGLSVRTDILQPSVDLSVTSMIGTSTLSYSLTEGYAAYSASTFVQTIAQSLDLTIPLIAENITGATTSLAVTPGVSNTFFIVANQPFPVAAPIENPAAFLFSNQYALNLGLSFSRARDAPPRSIFPRNAAQFSIQGSYAPGTSSAAALSSVFVGSVSVPSPFRHQVLRFGFKTSYSTYSLATPVATTIHPRGMFIPTGTTGDPVYQQNTPGRSIASVDYLFNLALLDTPLLLGLNLQGVALGLHVAAAADWNPTNGLFQPDPSLYAGAEIVALVGYQAGGSAIPVGFGITVRFDPSFSRPFDPLHDIGPYIFFGTNSFISSGLSPAASLTTAARSGALRAES